MTATEMGMLKRKLGIKGPSKPGDMIARMNYFKSHPKPEKALKKANPVAKKGAANAPIQAKKPLKKAVIKKTAKKVDKKQIKKVHKRK